MAMSKRLLAQYLTVQGIMMSHQAMLPEPSCPYQAPNPCTTINDEQPGRCCTTATQGTTATAETTTAETTTAETTTAGRTTKDSIAGGTRVETHPLGVVVAALMAFSLGTKGLCVT